MGGVAEPRPARASGVDVDRLHTKSSLSWPKPNDRALRPNARLSGVPGDTRGLPEIPRPSYGSRFDRAERGQSSSFGGATSNLPDNVGKRNPSACIELIKSGAKPNILL